VGAALEVLREAQPRTWALAGGSTPRALYERLGELDLPWREVECFFGDERCVPPEHEALNYRMVSRALLGRVRPRLHPMPFATCAPESYEALLRARLGPAPSLDVALLGLGADGHTASLFPGDPALEERERLVVRVERPDYARLTMTLPLLSASRLALFLVTSEAKRAALRSLLGGEPIPASLVRAGRVVVVADPEAMG
jgi:6-phosphogluconolactonase